MPLSASVLSVPVRPCTGGSVGVAAAVAARGGGALSIAQSTPSGSLEGDRRGGGVGRRASTRLRRQSPFPSARGCPSVHWEAHPR
jgi:hypothetical protein